MNAAVRALLSGLVDYAGLFPPAGLSMAEAVANYDRYRNSGDAWILGRLIVPAERLHECREELNRLERRPADWRISVLASAKDAPVVRDWNDRYADVKIDAVEAKASSTDAIAELAEAFADCALFVEIPPSSEPRSLIAAIAEAECMAKIRTGGVTPDAFPAAESVLRFMHTCREYGVPFKATAGLHHPVRCVRPLTYAEDSVTGTMHGFLNVFLSAVAVDRGDDIDLTALMTESDPRAFAISDDAIGWRDLLLDADSIAVTRERFAISFGSCSFDEPVADLREAGWEL